ncbi:MAG: Uncharacterised protein [Cellulomonadaceae bacterium TMED98]|nr:MAG: Uncharacterised protein [Cellulomonadaceae bacterium TMED98]
MFDVDLVDNAGARWDNFEVFKRGLTPAQELVTLSVSLILELHVSGEGVVLAEKVGNDRVVNDQFRRREGIDFLGIPSELNDGLPHGGQVDNAGHSSEVLENDACGGELDFR